MPSARVRTDTLPLDVAMAEICLQGARVGALIAKLKAAGMTEHVGVGLETELGRVALPGHHLAPARRSEGEPRSDVNTNGDGGSWSRLSRRSAPQVDAASTTEGEPFLARLGWFALWSTRRPVRLRRLRRRPRSAWADRTQPQGRQRRASRNASSLTTFQATRRLQRPSSCGNWNS